MSHLVCRRRTGFATRTAIVLLASMLIGSTAAQAAPFEFADFHLLNADQPLSLTNNSGISSTLRALSVPVIFNFTTQSGISTVDRPATLTINPVGTVAATTPASAAGNQLDQQIDPLRFSIIENGTGKNLLTMLAIRGDLIGLNGSVTGSLGDTSTNVYSSDYATFGATSNESFNFGLATISSPLSVGPGGFLNSFVSNIDGQFSADSAGFTAIVPEPASAPLVGIGVLALAATGATRRRQPRRN